MTPLSMNMQMNQPELLTHRRSERVLSWFLNISTCRYSIYIILHLYYIACLLPQSSLGIIYNKITLTSSPRWPKAIEGIRWLSTLDAGVLDWFSMRRRRKEEGKKKEEGRTMQMEEALQTSVAKPMFCVSFSAAAVK